MKVPTLAYGLTRDVKARSRKMIAALKKSASLLDAFGSETIDTRVTPGLLVLDGPDPDLGGSPHFHLYLPLRVLHDFMYEGHPQLLRREDEFFQATLTQPWATLGLIGGNSFWINHENAAQTFQPFLDAIFRYWQVFMAEGDRYTGGSPYGRGLWSVPTKIQFVLANLSVPVDVLRSPLPAEGPAALMKYVKLPS
jgi:hypothetical protein